MYIFQLFSAISAIKSVLRSKWWQITARGKEKSEYKPETRTWFARDVDARPRPDPQWLTRASRLVSALVHPPACAYWGINVADKTIHVTFIGGKRYHCATFIRIVVIVPLARDINVAFGAASRAAFGTPLCHCGIFPETRYRINA